MSIIPIFVNIEGRYFRLTCKLGKCKPCEQEYPSCENTADGLWPWPEYSHRPNYYMQCKNGRRIKKRRVPHRPSMGSCVFSLQRTMCPSICSSKRLQSTWRTSIMFRKSRRQLSVSRRLLCWLLQM